MKFIKYSFNEGIKTKFPPSYFNYLIPIKEYFKVEVENINGQETVISFCLKNGLIEQFTFPCYHSMNVDKFFAFLASSDSGIFDLDDECTGTTGLDVEPEDRHLYQIEYKLIDPEEQEKQSK